jgi:putative transposase
MTIVAGWRSGAIGLDGRSCVRSRASSHRTRFCGGIGQLIVRKWTYANNRSGRHGVLADIRRLVVRMAEENPTWGYTRIQGALTNVGHRVGRSTIARILKTHGVPPVPARPTSWQTFLRAHWGTVAGADFLTTDVWTWRGLVTYYTVFVLDLASRCVQIVGSTPLPTVCSCDR